MLNSLRFRLSLIFIGLAVGPSILVGAIVGHRCFASFARQSLALQREVAASVGMEIRAFIEGRENELLLLDEVNDSPETTQVLAGTGTKLRERRTG